MYIYVPHLLISGLPSFFHTLAGHFWHDTTEISKVEKDVEITLYYDFVSCDYFNLFSSFIR
jgi:hypothetical protein